MTITMNPMMMIAGNHKPMKRQHKIIEIDWSKYPVRKCLSLHECKICGQKILMYHTYRDGGYGRRAHVKCVLGDKPLEEWPTSTPVRSPLSADSADKGAPPRIKPSFVYISELSEMERKIANELLEKS